MSFLLSSIYWLLSAEKEHEADPVCKRQKHLVNRQIEAGGMLLRHTKKLKKKTKKQKNVCHLINA